MHRSGIRTAAAGLAALLTLAACSGSDGGGKADASAPAASVAAVASALPAGVTTIDVSVPQVGLFEKVLVTR